MSARSIWLVSVVALAVTGLASGQVVESPKKAPAKKGLQRKKLNDILGRQALERLRIELNSKPIVLLPRLQIRPWTHPWIRTPSRIVVPKPNPFLTGEYAAVIGKFDRTRAKFHTTRDAKAARQLLDDLDRDVLAVRRELWKLERAAKKKSKADLLLGTQHLPILPQFPTEFDGVRVGRAPLGNLAVLTNGPNQFLVGDYRKAVDKVHDSFAKLKTIVDPRAARKVLDKMSRQILDARRALWEREQANRKAGRR
jgi:hypothetical protein